MYAARHRTCGIGGDGGDFGPWHVAQAAVLQTDLSTSALAASCSLRLSSRCSTAASKKVHTGIRPMYRSPGSALGTYPAQGPHALVASFHQGWCIRSCCSCQAVCPQCPLRNCLLWLLPQSRGKKAYEQEVQVTTRLRKARGPACWRKTKKGRCECSSLSDARAVEELGKLQS